MYREFNTGPRTRFSGKGRGPPVSSELGFFAEEAARRGVRLG